jgi:hypothetical protein
VNKYFDDEFKEYSMSRQNNNQLDTGDFNLVYNVFFALSLIAVLLLFPIAGGRRVVHVYACLIALMIINAFVTATFSTVHFRFQYRVFWLLPATNTVLILTWLFDRYNASPAARKERQWPGPEIKE